ncbi:MAG: response regulator [Planctomycetia bacterium]|nr:response regulator [Planctomycetia bacterium]
MPEEPTNILVVDDLPEKLLAYQIILEELGQNLVTANSGEEALRAVLKYDFAVILLDVQMPGMSGLETASLIRQRKRSAHTPIIFLTAFADEVLVAEGYAQGAVDYITTPVIPAILRAKVRVFCDLYRMTQLVRQQAEERIALAEERSKREAVEEANRRLAFSAKTGVALGQSLDQDVTRREVVRLPLTFLADLVVLVVLERGGEWKTLRAMASDVGPTLEEGIGRKGVPAELLGRIEQALTGITPDHTPEQVVVPLHAHGQIFAAIAFSRELSGRRFGSADLTLAEAYASRAAIALENARLYHEVQQADRQKNEFLSMLAHELRNPLAPIRNANAILHQEPADPARVRWAQGVIDRQLTHLVRLVDDLLDVSRITQGKIRLSIEPVDLEVMVSQAVEAIRPMLDQFGHKLEVTLPSRPLMVRGDPARLTQVLTNLLNNAVKYTDPGGRIFLRAERVSGNLGTSNGPPSDHSSRVSPSTNDSGVAEIRVRDTGIGISPELLPTVFDLFTQASRSLDRSQGGLGIGLTLVRRLVEMHGGTVEAHSEGPGKGSEFIARLPASPEQTQRPAEVVAPTEFLTRHHPLRIVVVDDNVDGAESLADLLSMLGHQVQVAHDGPAGLAVVRGFDPDLVFLDIGLPGMDGYEVARQLRLEPDSRAILAAISGYGRDEDRLLSRESGFSYHFVKPIDLKLLRTLLDSVRPMPVGGNSANSA